MKSGVVPGGSASVAVPPVRVPPPDEELPLPHALSATRTASAAAAAAATLRGPRTIDPLGASRPLCVVAAQSIFHTSGIGRVRRRHPAGADQSLGLGQVGLELAGGGPPVAGEQQLGDLAIARDEWAEQVGGIADHRERESQLGVDNAEERADPLAADQLHEPLVEGDVECADLL